VIGIRLPDAADVRSRSATEAIVIFGEIGSSQEEELSQLSPIEKSPSRDRLHWWQSGARRHALQSRGAIIEGGRGRTRQSESAARSGRHRG
jgi:hypothetical protein